MKRLKFLMFILCVFCLTSVRASELRLTYSPVADQFHLMDNVSESAPGFFLIPEYKSIWIERYGLSDQDRLYLENYRQVRKKHQNPDLFTPAMMEKSGLFAPNPEDVGDVIADAFYTSETFEEAFQKASLDLSAEDLQLLKDFFNHFSEKASQIQTFAKASLEKVLAYFNKELASQQTAKHLANITSFYQSSHTGFKSIRVLLAVANTGSFNGRCYGDHLQIIIPVDKLPVEDESLMKFLTSVIVHEATHHISGMAKDEQKQKLTSCFMEKIGPTLNIDFLNAIEEPLVMASQILFMKNRYPEVYSKNSQWFEQPLAGKYLELLEPYIQEEKSIDADFVTSCARALTSR